jgi:hypothetical protein
MLSQPRPPIEQSLAKHLIISSSQITSGSRPGVDVIKLFHSPLAEQEGGKITLSV